MRRVDRSACVSYRNLGLRAGHASRNSEKALQAWNERSVLVFGPYALFPHLPFACSAHDLLLCITLTNIIPPPMLAFA